MEPYKQNVSCKYGAPMGRPSTRVEGKVHLRRVPLVDGDYDQGGAYWGSGRGGLWCAWNDDGVYYLRARSRADAKARLPGCTFYR